MRLAVKRLIAIGDIHGCVDELTELLALLAPGANDRVVFLGDLVDRGPDSPGTVRIARETCGRSPGSTLILGNHEQKLLRKIASGKPATLPAWVGELREPDMTFLGSARLFARDDARRLLFVHGGIFPRYFEHHALPPDSTPLAQLDRKHRDRLERFTMIRHVDERGDMVSLSAEGPNTTFWAERYDGREGLICFGHSPEPEGPRRFSHALGLDTGCAFGGKLTAAVFTSPEPGQQPEIVQVQARKTYAVFRADSD